MNKKERTKLMLFTSLMINTIISAISCILVLNDDAEKRSQLMSPLLNKKKQV